MDKQPSAIGCHRSYTIYFHVNINIIFIQVMLDVGCITDLFKCEINWVVPIIIAAVIIQVGISLIRDIRHAYLIITLNCYT